MESGSNEKPPRPRPPPGPPPPPKPPGCASASDGETIVRARRASQVREEAMERLQVGFVYDNTNQRSQEAYWFSSTFKVVRKGNFRQTAAIQLSLVSRSYASLGERQVSTALTRAQDETGEDAVCAGAEMTIRGKMQRKGNFPPVSFGRLTSDRSMMH